MTRWSENRFTANDMLLDRQVVDSHGVMAGRVDDVEFTDPAPGALPVLTALLCGSTAFGPRVGGRLGTWWLSVGRRLRPVVDSYPNRIPLAVVEAVDRDEVRLAAPRDQLDSYRFRAWVQEKVIGRIPGSGR
jgi:hypothetical protein